MPWDYGILALSSCFFPKFSSPFLFYLAWLPDVLFGEKLKLNIHGGEAGNLDVYILYTHTPGRRQGLAQPRILLIALLGTLGLMNKSEIKPLDVLVSILNLLKRRFEAVSHRLFPLSVVFSR